MRNLKILAQISHLVRLRGRGGLAASDEIGGLQDEGALHGEGGLQGDGDLQDRVASSMWVASQLQHMRRKSIMIKSKNK